MKTTISIFLTVIFGLFLSGINVNAQNCIYCNSNTVGDSSSAIGVQNTSAGFASLASGKQCTALGDYSGAFGHKSEANKKYSFAFGQTAIADQRYAFALGKYIKALQTASIAIGTYLIANNDNSIVIGKGAGFSDNQRLYNDVENSLMIGFNSNLPTFFVGPSDDFGKTGRIGIGNVTSPEAKLHIRADDNEDASLLLEPTDSEYSGKLMIGDDAHTIEARQGNNMEFKTETDKNFVFQNGSIFIQDAFEGLILKSPDGQCWKGTADNSGNFVLENVDCGQLTGKNESPAVSQKTARIFPNPAGSKLYVEIPEGIQQTYVSIYNEQGVLLQSRDMQSGKNSVSLKKMPVGVLIVKVYSGSGELLSTEKIMHK